MLTTPELIIALERRGVLPAPDVARVRQLYENSPTEFVPRVMFKWLVNRGRITAVEADKLLHVDPDLTAAQALDLVLGRADEELQLAVDDGEHDEDTKDMPREDARDLTLAPPGAAPFADSPAGPRPSLISSKESPADKQPAAAEAKPADPRSTDTAKPPRHAAAELLDELFAEAGGPGGGPGLRPPTAALRLPTNRNRWDSPLMLVGGGALLFIVGLSAFLIWRIGRQGGDDAFAAAEEAYRSGGYGTAVERYDAFLASYPSHRSAGTAAVHRGMARLRLAVEAGGDWSRTLGVAREVLPGIASQPAFAAAKSDLAALLPDIAENLAKRGAAADDGTAAAEAREAAKLVEKYVGANDAIAPRMREIDALIAAAERRLLREASLRSTIDAVRAAAVARSLSDAANARTALLAEFPDLADDARLNEALAELAETKRQAIRFAVGDAPAETAEPDSPILRKVTLADRRLNEKIADVDDAYFSNIEGTLFAYDVADGAVRWTRRVGFDAGQPTIVAGASGRDVVLFDGVQNALVRVAASDGRLRWRQAQAASPTFVIDGERIFVTLPSRAAVLDVATGALVGEIDFPTPLSGVSTSDPRGRVRYQPARADDLYIVSNEDYRGLRAFPLGHAAGAIAVPPVCVGPYVLIAENVGERSRLRLFETSADAASLKEIATRTLDGRVTLPPQVSQRLVAVVTNGGPTELFDLSGAADRKPLEPVARLLASQDRIVRRHFLFQGTQLWLGGRGLTLYEFQAGLGKLTAVRTLLVDHTTLQSPQRAGSAVVCRTQPADYLLPSVTAALEAARTEPFWETSAAAAPLGPALVSPDGKTLTSVTTDGSIYDVDDATPASLYEPSASFGSQVAAVDEFAAAAAVRHVPSVQLPDGAHAFVIRDVADDAPAAEAKHSLLVVEPVGATTRTSRTSPIAHFVAPPTAFLEGVVVPTDEGRLEYLDPRTGRRRTEPFVPPQSAAGRIAWSPAYAVGSELIVSDQTRIFRLGVEPQPQPFLKALATATLVRPVRLLGAAGQTAYAVDDAGELAAYALPELRAGESWKFRGARNWRSVVSGDRVSAAAAADPASPAKPLLLCLGDDGRLVWQTSFDRGASGAPAFLPVRDGAAYFAVDEQGDVVRFDGDTGKERGRVILGVPAAAAPIVVGDRLAIVTQAGEILWIAKP